MDKAFRLRYFVVFSIARSFCLLCHLHPDMLMKVLNKHDNTSTHPRYG